MQTITRSGTLNSNSPGSQGPRPHRRGSSREVGGQPAQLGELGTGTAFAEGDRLGSDRAKNCRELGGQATGPGLFGLRIDGNIGSAPAVASGLSAKGLRSTQTLIRRPLVLDEFEGYGLARPSTPAMCLAARASAQHDKMNWHEAAEVLACVLND